MDKYIENNLYSFIREVKKAMIEYYGEEYKDLIESRLDNTNFIFYINDTEFKNFYFPRKNNPTDKYDELKKQFKSLRREIKKGKRDRIIYTDIEYPTDIFCKEKIVSSICRNVISFSPTYDKTANKMRRYIFLPVFRFNDETIIHEMIHSVLTEELFMDEDGFLMKKTGLMTTDSDQGEVNLEEYITDREAKEIYTIIKSRGINFMDRFYPNKSFNSLYSIFKNLVDKFYDYFKDEIIKARFTLNKNELIELIDKKAYQEFTNIIKLHYENYDDDCDALYSNSTDKVINEMKENYLVRRLK